MATIGRVTANRYVQPLREGGSLPAVVDTDGGLFVVKFRGAGQGPKALIAEVIVGLLARALGLPVPDLALVEIPPPFGRSEPDPEIQDVLRKSHGLNAGLRYLDGALNFDSRAAGDLVDGAFASRLVWLDAFTTNPDRTHQNPNLLVWNRRPWLIDHGAALYAHHDWESVDDARIRTPFPLISKHLLLRAADGIEHADTESARELTDETIGGIVDQLPDAWLLEGGDAREVAELRARYRRYLTTRLRAPRAFVSTALESRSALLAAPSVARSARR